MPIALILIFALGSIGVYGFIVGGWASESKYSLLGSMRTCAQLVSYEVSLALSRARRRADGAVARLVDIVDKQEATLWFFVPQSSASSSSSSPASPRRARPPFDLPEADTELVAGYHTEYSGMRWGLFQMAEYINLIVLSALAVTLFFGGWHGPWVARPSGRSGSSSSSFVAPLRLHLAARDAAAPALRPADALRLEGAAAGRDDQRASSPRSWWC